MLTNEIRDRNLPKTFREAVEATRRLNTKLLWINSLYIVQGSDLAAKADWLSEAVLMEVYTNSYCNSTYVSFRVHTPLIESVHWNYVPARL